MDLFEHLKKIKDDSGYFAFIAACENVYLTQHKDEDLLWSMTTVQFIVHRCVKDIKDGDCKGKTKHNPVYKRNLPVACYFVFGELGKAIALRPGDVVIFNALQTHSVSGKTEFYKDKKMFV